METLTSTYPSNFLNLSNIPLLSPSRFKLTGSLDLVKREIVDLKMKSCSYNEIVDHFKNTAGLKVSRNFISDIIKEAGRRARHLNGIYDSKVRDRFSVVEIDETFQGRGSCYLGVVDKASHYLLSLVQLPSRALECFKNVLKPLANHLSNVNLVVTDGYPGYKNLIPEIFEGIAHLFCHVHAHRVFLKELLPLHSKAKKAYSALKKNKVKLAEVKHELSKKKRCLERDEARLQRAIQMRDAFYQQKGIKKYSRKTKWTTKRLKLANKLNHERVDVRSRKKTIESKKARILKLEAKIAPLKTKFWEKKQVSLQSARLVEQFKRVLATPAAGFDRAISRYLEILARSAYPVAKRILRFLKLNPHVFSTSIEELEVVCPSWQANTNIIEGIFGISRPLLDKARRFHNSPQSKALMEIFRLKHNLTPPFTGPNRHESPLTRAGTRSRHESYLDALFPGNGKEIERFEQVLQRATKLEHQLNGPPSAKNPRDCQYLQSRQIWVMNDGISTKTAKSCIKNKKGYG